MATDAARPPESEPPTAGDGDGDGGGEAAWCTDQQLQEKVRRTEEALASGIAARLPDRGEKLRRLLRQLKEELDCRRRLRLRPPPPRPRPPLPPPRRDEDDVRCDRLIQSRCAETSGLVSDSSANHTVTKSDLQSAFIVCFNQRLDEKAGLNESRKLMDDKPKVHEEEAPSKLSSQPAGVSHRESPFRCVSSFANKENMLSNDDCKEVGSTSMPKNAHLSAHSPKRKRASAVGCSMRLRSSKVQEVVLLDEDVQHSQSTPEDTSNKWNAMKIYYPSREHPDSVELSHEDVKCLDPESYLCSTVMNFYIMYIQRPISPTSRPRGEYYIFNTYFYSKLEEAVSPKGDRSAYFLKLRRWWKGINIFQKAYILLPVHADTHWSLAIICIPAQEDESGPVILHLDSLKFHCSRLIFSVIDKFLKEEWNYLNKNDAVPVLPIQERIWKNLPRRIERRTISVPQQDNDYDCGLFVLYFMERFIQEAPERLRKKDLPSFGKKWFRPGEAPALRKQMRALLLELFEDAKSENGKIEPAPFEHSTGVR